MTFVKNSSSRIDLVRKPSATETPPESPSDGSPLRQAKKESPRWEPTRKFVPRASDESSPKREEPEPNRDILSKRSPDAEQSRRVKQRMRDLYDFKTENEWPKRAANAGRGIAWISKSGSEEDKNARPGRRNSQDLEFNDRAKLTKLKDAKVKSAEEKRGPKEDRYTETFNSEYEERLRKFNDRLRYSEDLGTTKPKLKERRTYSDDYDQKRRASTRSARVESSLKQEASVRSTRSARSESSKSQDATRSPVEKKRTPEVGVKSKATHAETCARKDSRRRDATIAKRDSSSGDAPAKSAGKRASMDVKGTGKMVQVPPRRAFSQSEERPAAPVPPVEWNDDRYAAARLKEIAENREERDSTRYKVYLT